MTHLFQVKWQDIMGLWLFSSEFEEFFAKLPDEQKAALKAQIIVSVQQEPSKTVRKKCADLAAEVSLSFL